MRIIDDTKLDFDDVLISPKRSQLTSRKDADLTRKFTFKHSSDTWTGIPIVASNMDHTGTIAMCHVLMKYPMLTALCKFVESSEWGWNENIMRTVGLDDDLDLDLFRALGTLESPALLPDNTRIGGLRGQGLINASTYAFKPSAEIYFQADGATSSSSSAGKIKFATTPSGATSTVDRMVIRNDGKVGIGTNDPIEHIEVKRAGDNDMQFTSASNNPPNLIFYNTGGSLEAPGPTGTNQEIGSMIFKTHDGVAVREIGGMRLYIDGTPTNGSTPSKFVITTTPSGTTNQAEVVTIDNQGYMGVGVSDPQARLDISGNVKIVDGTQGNGRVLTSDANGNAGWQTPPSSQAMLRNNIIYTSSGSDFLINYSNELFSAIPGASYNGTTLTLPQGIYEIESNIFLTDKNAIRPICPSTS